MLRHPHVRQKRVRRRIFVLEEQFPGGVCDRDPQLWLKILDDDDAPRGGVKPEEEGSLVQFRTYGDGCSWGSTSPELRHLGLPAVP
jgi:hypothetical protein